MGKKVIILGLAALMLSIGGALFAQTMVTLDQAISYSANEIENRLEQGVKVVVLNFNSPSLRLSNYVLDEMTNILTRNGKLSVAERVSLEFILRELNYQRSGNISDESAQSIGRILGVQYIISGAIEEVSSNYVIQFKTMAVEPEALQTLARVSVRKDAQIDDLMGANIFDSMVSDISSLVAKNSSLTLTDTSDLNRKLVLSAGGGVFGGAQILHYNYYSNKSFKLNNLKTHTDLSFGVPLFVTADIFKYLSVNLSLYYINTRINKSHFHDGVASLSVFGQIPKPLNDNFTIIPFLGVGYDMFILSKQKGIDLYIREDISNDSVYLKPGVGLNYNLTGDLRLNASFIWNIFLYGKDFSIKDIKEGIIHNPSLFLGANYIFLRI